MRRLAVLLFLCVVCLAYQGCSESKSGAFVPDHQWKAQVLQSREPVVVDFWATWCGPCRKMHPVMDAVARDYKVLKVDVDSNPNLAARYKINEIPAILVFKDGEVVAHLKGYMPEADLRKELKQISKQ